MTLDMWITLAILAAAIVLFITEKLRVDVVALGVLVLLMLTGILTTSEALAGFSSTPVLTIASLFIVGGAVLYTGLASMIADRIVHIAGSDEVRLTAATIGVAAVMSGFMSDTGVVAVLLPTIISLSRTAKVSPSRLLIPLAYGSLLGGAATLIGTPPNIIVSDLLRQEGYMPFGFFSYTPLGLALVAAGIVFMVTVGRRLLHDRKRSHPSSDLITPHELMKLYQLSKDLFQVRVSTQSPLAGQSLAASRLRSDFGVNVLKILRPVEAHEAAKHSKLGLAFQTNGHRTLHPTPEMCLKTDDLLMVRGNEEAVSRAAAHWDVGVQPASPDDQDALITHKVGIAEVLIRPRSSLIGKTLQEVKFGPTYQLTVLEIRRPGVDERLNTQDTTLRIGDMLLVQGQWSHIFSLKRHQRHNFIVMGEPEALTIAVRRDKVPIAFFILVGMLIMMVMGESSIATASMLAALAVVLTGCLTMDEAYASIDWKSLVLIAGMLPMSTALQKVGLVDLIASGFTDVLGTLGPLVILGGLFLLTSLLTQVLSNTATAVLIAPIALATAESMNVQPYAFLMAVAVAASMAFASPVASPVNALVMGAGEYRFSDYVKVGVPMIVITLVITMLVLPILWPF